MALDLSSTYIDLINAVNNAKVGKTSELENDSGFITETELDSALESIDKVTITDLRGIV